MTVVWPLLALAALLVAGAAVALAWVLRVRVAQLTETAALLETQLKTVQEQSRLELLAMGQRIIEAEKQVRRLTDRLEAVEAVRAPAERYGQLDARLAAHRTDEGPPESPAESALRDLLKRGGTPAGDGKRAS